MKSILCKNTEGDLRFDKHAAENLMHNWAPVNEHTASGYPHEFSNNKGDVIKWPNGKCEGSRVLEFPIFEDGHKYPYDEKPKARPGPARIIYSTPSKDFCGIIAHEKGSEGPLRLCQEEPATGPSAGADFDRGWCGFHLVQWQPPLMTDNFQTQVEVTIDDATGTQIGRLDRTDAVQPVSVFSELREVLVVSPQSQGGNYIQFALGDDFWRNTDASRCTTGEWDDPGDDWLYRRMDCGFAC